MASLRRIPRTGVWQVRFYWNGEQRQRSCDTKSHSEANRVLGRVEDTLHLFNTGRLEVPPEVDAIEWIVSGGTLQPKPEQKDEIKQLPFGKLCEAYFEDQKQKAPVIRTGEKVHINHLKRILTSSIRLESIDLDTLKKYHKRRSRQKQRYHQELCLRFS